MMLHVPLTPEPPLGSMGKKALGTEILWSCVQHASYSSCFAANTQAVLLIPVLNIVD